MVVLSRAKSRVKCANNFLKSDEMKIMTGTDERQNIRCLSTQRHVDATTTKKKKALPRNSNPRLLHQRHDSHPGILPWTSNLIPRIIRLRILGLELQFNFRI